MKRMVTAFLFLILVPMFTLAQRSKDSWDNLKQLRPGQKIEVVDAKMKSFRGKFVSLTDDGIALREGKSEMTVLRPDVVRVSVRDTSRRTRNMLIGAAIGVGAGLAIAMPILGICSNEGNCGTNETAGSALAIAGLGAGGVGIGAIPGSRTIYRVQTPKGSTAP